MSRNFFRPVPFLLTLARTRLGGALLRWSFAHMSHLLPVQNKLYESERVLAFRHPQPAYPTHILLVPKRPIPSLSGLTPADFPTLDEIYLAAQALVKALDLEASGYRLIVNGGACQDVPLLHFHLVSG